MGVDWSKVSGLEGSISDSVCFVWSEREERGTPIMGTRFAFEHERILGGFGCIHVNRLCTAVGQASKPPHQLLKLRRGYLNADL